MQIPGPIPFHAAQAYGASPTRSVERVAPIEGVAKTAGSSTLADRLIAGRVAGAVDFDGGVPASSESLPLYTRAADMVEAAVAVARGTVIDVTG
jgi:hypothetical protein